MFGAEGDRIQQMRMAQAQQLKEDLERQIEEKQQRGDPFSPNKPSYDPVPYNQRAHNPVQGGFQQNRNQQNYKPYRPPQYPVNTFHRQNVAAMQAGGPIALKYAQPSNADIVPVLPRVPHATVVDPSSFGQRVNSVDQMVGNISNVIAAANNKADTLETDIIPHINIQINQIREDLERLSGTECANQARVLIENAKANRRIVEVSENSVKTEISNARERINEANAAIGQFVTKFNDFSENTKVAFIGVKSDIGRQKQAGESTSARINEMTNRVNKNITNIGQVSRSFDSFDQEVTSSYNSLQSSVGSLTDSVTRQLGGEIKTENGERIATIQALAGQSSEINQRASSSVQQLKVYINEMVQSFSSSMSTIQQSTEEAIEQTMSGNEAYTSDIGNNLDSLIGESESNFQAIQSEVLQTVNQVKSTAMESTAIIESTLQEESDARRKNAKEIRDKYEHFAKSVKDEIVVQTEAAKEMNAESYRESTKHLHRISDPIFGILNPLCENAAKINEIDTKMGDLEGILHVLTTQFVESIGSLTRNLSEITEQSKVSKIAIDSGFKDLYKRLDSLNESEADKDNAHREELHDFSGRFDNDVDDRLTDIENQISVALASIAELTLGYPVPIPKRAPRKARTNPKPVFDTKGQETNLSSTQKSTENDEVDPIIHFDSSQPIVIGTKSLVTDRIIQEEPKADEVKEEPKEEEKAEDEEKKEEETKDEEKSKVIEPLDKEEESKIVGMIIDDDDDYSEEDEEEEQSLPELDPTMKQETGNLMFNPEDFVIKLSPRQSKKDNKKETKPVKPAEDKPDPPKEPAKDLKKEPAKETKKEPAKETKKEPAEDKPDPPKEPAKDLKKEPAKDTKKEPAKETKKETVKEEEEEDDYYEEEEENKENDDDGYEEDDAEDDKATEDKEDDNEEDDDDDDEEDDDEEEEDAK